MIDLSNSVKDFNVFLFTLLNYMDFPGGNGDVIAIQPHRMMQE